MASLAFSSSSEISVSQQMQPPAGVPGAGTLTDSRSLVDLNQPFSGNSATNFTYQNPPNNTEAGYTDDYTIGDENLNQFGLNGYGVLFNQSTYSEGTQSPGSITDVAGTGGSPLSVTVMPGPNDDVGDPVTVQLSALWGIGIIQGTNISASLVITFSSSDAGGTIVSQTFTSQGNPEDFDPTIIPIKFAASVGQTFAVTIDNQTVGTIAAPAPTGTGENFKQSLLLEIALPSGPQIALNSLSWVAKQGGVDFGYQVSGGTLPSSSSVDFYWATGPTEGDELEDQPIFLFTSLRLVNGEIRHLQRARQQLGHGSAGRKSTCWRWRHSGPANPQTDSVESLALSDVQTPV